VDNVAMNVTTETLVDQKVGAQKCKVRRIDKSTVALNFDIYGNLSADVLALALPNAVVTQTDAGTPVTETITFPSGSWCSDDIDNISYAIPYGNNDGTLPIVTVTGSVDGALIDGTDFELEQISDCVGFQKTFNSNFLNLLAHGGFGNTLTTDDQDLVIEVTYIPATVTSIEFRP
jgi:hypothetical protein